MIICLKLSFKFVLISMFSFLRRIVTRIKLRGTIYIFSLSPAFGQSPIFQSFSLPNKYETLEINKTLQDKTGFIWLATNKGLFKFDGINYWSFVDNLPDENVTALAQDSVGTIWAGFKNGKIYMISKNHVEQFNPEEGLPSMQISDLMFDREGTLWFSTYGDGIYYFLNNRLYRLDDVDGMPDLYAYDLEEDSQGKIWAGTDGGIAICTREKNSVTIETINYSNGLPDNIIRKIAKGNSSMMLLATEDAGLIGFDLHTYKAVQLVKDKWSFGSIVDFILIDDWIWVATEKGLAVIDWSEEIRTVKIQSTDRVTALSSDAEGGVWIGSKAGVQRTMGKQLQFFDPEDDNNVIATTIGAEGDIWFSTSSGLFRQTKKGGRSLHRSSWMVHHSGIKR